MRFMLIGLLLSGTAAAAQNPTLQGHPDDYLRADIEYGARLYTEHCSGCHGANGDGVAGVELRTGKFRNAVTDPQLRTVITNGFPTTGMPAFKFDPVELTGFVAYLRGATESGDAWRRTTTASTSRRIAAHEVDAYSSPRFSAARRLRVETRKEPVYLDS